MPTGILNSFLVVQFQHRVSGKVYLRIAFDDESIDYFIILLMVADIRYISAKGSVLFYINNAIDIMLNHISIYDVVNKRLVLTGKGPVRCGRC